MKEMDTTVASSHVLTNVPDKEESATERLQGALCELQNRVHKYHEHMDHVKEMCAQTELNIERIKVRADQQCMIVKRDSTRQAWIISRLTELNEELVRVEEKYTAPQQQTMAVTRRFLNYVKIGCAFVFGRITAYTMF